MRPEGNLSVKIAPAFKYPSGIYQKADLYQVPEAQVQIQVQVQVAITPEQVQPKYWSTDCEW